MVVSPANRGRLKKPQPCMLSYSRHSCSLIVRLSRSHLPEGVRTKSWEDRMQKTQKALAIKKLQTELKEEKQAELQRFAAPPVM
jgi:hypothetical protein